MKLTIKASNIYNKYNNIMIFMLLKDITTKINLSIKLVLIIISLMFLSIFNSNKLCIYCISFTSSINNYEYFPKKEYRKLNILTEDLSSYNYFSKNFNISMNIKSNNAIDYFHSCVDEYSFNGNTNFFGFFQKGFIQKFFYYENYGSLGISFDVFLQDNRYISIDTDCLEILVNNNLVKSIKLTDLKLESSNKIDLCEYKVFSKVIMIKYIHNDPYGYYPVSLKILSKFSEYSTPLWGIKNLYVEKIECPGKCIVCNSTDCIGCGDKQQIGESVISGCSCNNKISLNNIIDNSQELLYDFSDSDDILDCKSKDYNVFIINVLIRSLFKSL